jgi:hypothetical protein
VLATRLTLKLARGMFFVSAGFGVLLGGGIILVAATAGVCAAAVVTLYGAAHLFADLFGFSFRWGLGSLEEPRLHAGFAKGRACRRRAGTTR